MIETGGYVRLLRTNADFRRVYSAQLISFAGDWFLVVPLLGLIFEETGSELATTAVLVAESLPMFLFSPLAGLVADRLDRKLVMVVADIGRAGAAFALILVNDLQSPALAFVLVAAVASGSAFFFPASNSALPNLVDDEDLATASVLVGSAWGTMAAVGAALGGAVAAAVGRDAAFSIDAASFLISAWLIFVVRRPFSRGVPRTQPGFVASLREAAAYAGAHPQVAALLTSKSGFALVAGAIAVFPLISIDLFDAGDTGTGLLYGARGLGALIGPLLVKRWLGHSDRLLVGSIGYAVALWGACYLLLAAAPALGWAVCAVGFAHLGGGVEWAMSTYGLQRTVPDDVRGRIFSFDFGALTLTMSAAFLSAGALAGAIGVRSVVALSGSLGLVGGLLWSQVTRKYWRLLDG